MAFIPFINTVRAEIVYVLNGQIVENTLYFKFATAVDVVDMEGLGADLDAWVQAAIMTNLSVDCGFKSLKLTLLGSDTDPVVEINHATPVAGANVGSPLPNGSTFCIQFKTLKRGRSFRGRNYVPGLTVTMTTDANHVVDTWAGDMVTAYEELLDPAFYTSDWTWVVASRQEDGVVRTTGETTPVYAVGYHDLTIDSQRRRLPGRGS